jgi:phenylalanyl-tRNA synthetase alpha chain
MENSIEQTELQKHTELLALDLQNGLREIKMILKNHDLDQLKSRYLGKGSSMSSVMSTLRHASPDLKKQIGELTNKFKTQLETAIETQREYILEQELNAKLALETIDVTVSGNGDKLGSFHPVSLSENRMINIFCALGFDIADGPEIETDYYNFEALNIPKNHPARAMQDTFYTETNHVLRTHTSPMQVRYAEINTPPIKIIAPGRVYRIDMDATHSPMFHQLEGLWIDKNISFANLKGVMIEFLKKFFENENLEIRFRASFFPFTEPSAEVDIMSKNGKWLEVAGCGMVHPHVLQAMNIDPNVYSGFAFGIGIDRFTMLKYGINDLRLMFENNLDFLNQFQVCH